MSKGLRLTEKWMQRGLWLVAFIFAGFLIGLGGKIVANLGDVEPAPSVEQFIDPVAGPAARAAAEDAERRRREAVDARDQAALKHQTARSNSRQFEETFNNWLSTRRATERPEQDPELVTRTRELDRLKAEERAALALVEAQDKALLDANQAYDAAQRRLDELREPAEKAYWKAQRQYELKVFLFRLALTLPLLLAAGWLFAKKRKTSWWPFVWGFIFFALFAFFVELVPYLPSYGGYVRYLTGIVLTLVVGRYAIVALQRYLARQKAAESLPDAERRGTLRYDVAMSRLAKQVCPGCERSVDLKDPTVDFCPHCGIGLFERCGKCSTRRSSFARFCFACGAPGSAKLPD